MYSLVADIFITTGLISDPIELLRVVGLLHGDPVGRWISTRCFQWLALIFCVWHIPMWQATLDDIKKCTFYLHFFPFFFEFISQCSSLLFFYFFFSYKKKKKSKTEKNKQKTWCRETRPTSLSARFPSPPELRDALCRLFRIFWLTVYRILGYYFFSFLPRRSYIHSE